MSFSVHIDKLVNKVNKRIGLIKHATQFLNQKYAIMLYKSLVLPMFDYGDTLYMHASEEQLSMLQVMRNKFAQIILRAQPLDSTASLHNRSKIIKLVNRRKLHFAVLVFKCMKGLVPAYLSEKLVLVPMDRGRITRSNTRGICKSPIQICTELINHSRSKQPPFGIASLWK